MRVEVTAAINCTSSTNPLFVVAYLGAFDPTQLEKNYLADLGSSPAPTPSPVTLALSSEVPAGATITLVIHEVNAQPTALSCGSYSMKVIGLPKACPLSNLSLTKSGAPPVVRGGTNLTYTINGANAGPRAAANVSFSDAVPANTTFQSLTSANYVQKFLDHAKLSTTSRYLNIERDGMHAALKGFEKQRKTQERKRKRNEDRARRGNPWQTNPASDDRAKSGRANKPVQ